MTTAEQVKMLGHERTRRGAALDQITAELRTAVRHAIEAGMSEVEAARLAGVSRPTVRAWLGK